jgi:hypothetical protein
VAAAFLPLPPAQTVRGQAAEAGDETRIWREHQASRTTVALLRALRSRTLPTGARASRPFEMPPEPEPAQLLDGSLNERRTQF